MNPMNPYIITDGPTTLACVRDQNQSRVSGTMVLSTGLEIDFEVRRGVGYEFYSNVIDHSVLGNDESAVFFDGQFHVMRQPTRAERAELLALVSCKEGITTLKDALAARVWSAQPAHSTRQLHSINPARARYLRAAIALSTTRLGDDDDLHWALAISSSLFFRRAYQVLTGREYRGSGTALFT